MKGLSPKELREKSDVELRELVLESRKTQLKYRMQKAAQTLTSSHLVNLERKNVARIKTILQERKVGAEGVRE